MVLLSVGHSLGLQQAARKGRFPLGDKRIHLRFPALEQRDDPFQLGSSHGICHFLVGFLGTNTLIIYKDAYIGSKQSSPDIFSYLDI